MSWRLLRRSQSLLMSRGSCWGAGASIRFLKKKYIFLISKPVYGMVYFPNTVSWNMYTALWSKLQDAIVVQSIQTLFLIEAFDYHTSTLGKKIIIFTWKPVDVFCKKNISFLKCVKTGILWSMAPGCYTTLVDPNSTSYWSLHQYAWKKIKKNFTWKPVYGFFFEHRVLKYKVLWSKLQYVIVVQSSQTQFINEACDCYIMQYA